MASATESSLIARLENSDYRGLHKEFIHFLQPFSDFVSLDVNVDSTNHSKKKKNNQKTTKKKNNEIKDPKLIRPLAKQFLTFISRALKLLQNRLFESTKPGGEEVEEEIALELFDIYKLCLDCLSCLSSCLDCKPFCVHFQRIRLVHCLEARGRYREAELEGFSILESVRSVSSIKEKKVEGQYLPYLGTENADPELAWLIVEIVVSLVKCSFKSQRKEETVYRRVLALVDQVIPWLRVLDSKAHERLHRVLVTDLYRCTLFMLGDDRCFDGELVHMFCMTSLTECLKSSMKDQFLKLAHNICSSLSSQWVSRPSLICDILQCAVDSIACECKVGVEGIVNEFLDLVHYCVKRCRLSGMDTCSDVARHLNKIANKFIQVLAPIDSILRLYAAGLYSDFMSRCSKFTVSENSMDESAITFLPDNGENLQHLPALLGSLSSYFNISSNECSSLPSCAEKDMRSVSCPTIGFDFGCSIAYNNEHGKASFLSYLNALAFFCQPLAEIFNRACKQIVAEMESAPLSSEINYIQDAFHQFCDVFLIGFSSTSGRERERFCESLKTFLHVSIAAFTISLRTDINIQKSVDCIDHTISRGWLQSKEMKFLITSIYNIGADLYNTKQVQLASVALELCCRSSWTHVSLLCKKFIEKSERIPEDLSEESIIGFVTEACAKSVILLDVLHQRGSPDVNRSMVNCLLNWSLAGNLFESLSGPMALLRKWVKIMCKDFMDVDVKAPTLYSLLSESSATLSKRMIGIILEQELLAYEEMEALNKNLCQRMQLKIIDILLLNVYVTKDYSLHKSRILIRKGRVFRAPGIEGLNNCMQCLSEAMSILIDMSGEYSSSAAPIFHQLALAYCLHALCTQEVQPNLEVILHDIRQALKLWSSINWSADVHHELVTENAIPLLCCIADLLSLKGYLDFQYDIYKLVIILLKQKNIPVERCLAMLWADRRLTHALCISPVDEDFILNVAQHFDVHSDSVGFWISCIKDSQPLLTGFRQKFFLSDSIFPQVGRCQRESNLGSDITIDEVKEAASALISSVHVPSSTFLAGYLYYDLCERFMSNGQLFEALSYAREALRLRTKLLQKKFICTFGKLPKNSSETGETTQQHEYNRTHLEVLGSVASEVWPSVCGSWNLEGCILSQWNVLQCYLESILQIGAIHEAIGNVTVAEALLLQGKNISSTEDLPIFGIAFASALGEIYCKKQLWDLAESELNSAKQILVNGSTAISCKRCKLTLEITVDQRIGDLTRRRTGGATSASSVNSFSFALDLYRLALKKLNLPEWGSSLSFSEESEDEQKPRMTRSKYRSSRSRNIQVHDEVESGYTKYSSGSNGFSCSDTHSRRRSHAELNSSMAEFGCEEACVCNRRNCWRCLLMKVMEAGTMQDFIYMKWEFHRRRLSLRLFMNIGKCVRILGEVHEMHEIFWQSISMMVTRKPFCGTSSAIPHSVLLEFIGKERQGDSFAIERAALLYNISWFSLKNYCAGCSRITCCDLSRIKMPMIVSWLLQAFILCRELPLLFQKVSRLLAAVFLLSTSGSPFHLPLYSGKALSEIHWAAFFHQASLGTYLNHQFLSNPSGQLKARNTMDFEGSHVTGSTNTVSEACNLLRLAPEKTDGLEKFVTDFFQGLPSITIVCISLLDGDYASMLRDILPFPSSSPVWMLLSRLNSKGQPIVMLLPLDLIIEALDDDAKSETESVYEGNNSSKKWLCPWGYTVVDDVAPQFKLILEENYMSSSISPSADSQGNRLLWWTWRRKLNDRLDKFLRGIEESWLGPWICLLLGEPLDCKYLDSVLSELISELKCKCEFDANENLLRVILGGARSVSETEACVSQLLHKKYFVRGGCCREKKCGFSSTACDEVERLSGLPHQLILEAASKLEVECINREPIVLVLDSAVQMLPWENLPVLRKQEVYRMPSVGSISATLNINCQLQGKIGRTTASFPSIDPLDAFYLLNPSGDLECTQVEFEEWFRDQKLEGKAGTAPTTEELISALEHHDLFIYFGHGSGTQYMPGHEIQKLKICAATLLMGCSSGSLSLMGCYNPQGVILSYLLAGSPAIVANLWEVTDKDIDRFGKAVLNAWLEERSTSSIGCTPCNLIVEEFGSMKIGSKKGNAKRKVPRGRKLKEDCHSSIGKDRCAHRPMIGSFMSQAREACTLPLLIGASPVCYGVPTGIRKKKDL